MTDDKMEIAQWGMRKLSRDVHMGTYFDSQQEIEGMLAREFRDAGKATITAAATFIREEVARYIGAERSLHRYTISFGNEKHKHWHR